MKRFTGTLAAMATAAAVTMTGALPAQAAQAKPQERSIAEVLTSDGNKFDKNRNDFDIVTEAALAVLGAKPDSPVGLLADGSTRATVFAPTDQAFRLLAKDLTGKNIKSERKIFNTLVQAVGVDTIESVLLYHVVAGKTLTSKKVLKSHKAKIPTALGPNVQVRIRSNHENQPVIRLVDKDRNDRDPRVILGALDINKGNKQIAHGIDRVLRPADL